VVWGEELWQESRVNTLVMRYYVLCGGGLEQRVGKEGGNSPKGEREGGDGDARGKEEVAWGRERGSGKYGERACRAVNGEVRRSPENGGKLSVDAVKGAGGAEESEKTRRQIIEIGAGSI